MQATMKELSGKIPTNKNCSWNLCSSIWIRIWSDKIRSNFTEYVESLWNNSNWTQNILFVYKTNSVSIFYFLEVSKKMRKE